MVFVPVTGRLPYRVTVLKTNKDITRYVASVDSVKFQGSGKIRTASLTLDATDGAFISNPDYLGTGNTPILNQFDKLKLEFQENGSRGMVVEIDQELGQKNVNGRLLPIECKGRERALQDIKFTGYYQFKTPFYVLDDIRQRYNRNRGTAQPRLVFADENGGRTVNIPNNIVNIYDFTNETSFYDAVMHVINRLNQPTSFGGSGDFYSLWFWDAETAATAGIPDDTIVMVVGIQGPGYGLKILESTRENPFRNLSYQIQSQSGTQVLVRGAQNAGSIPGDFHRFQSAVEEINHLREYITGERYTAGTICRTNNILYRARKTVPSDLSNVGPPNAEYWEVVTPRDIIGDIQYSPWTNGKTFHHKNSCSNPTGRFALDGYDSPAFPDGNLVVREGSGESDFYVFYRDFVLVRATDPSQIPNEYLAGNHQTGFYNGLRILVNGTGTGAWAGTDKFGRNYANALVIYDDNNSWVVIRNPQVGDQCCVLSEGRTYEWNVPIQDRNAYGQAKEKDRRSWTKTQLENSKYRGPKSGTLAWRDMTDTASGNDAFHHPTSISQVEGLFPNSIHGDDYASYSTNSALRIQYDYMLTDYVDEAWSRITEIAYDAYDAGVNLFNTLFSANVPLSQQQQDHFRATEFYDFGWWWALPFPFPLSTHNNIEGRPGSLFGMPHPGNNESTSRDFAALDLQNANYGHEGNTGFNHADVTDLGGPITGFKFYFNFDILVGGTRKPFVGNIPFTVTIYDDLSQVWRSEFIYRFLGESMEIEIPFSSFTVNRPSRRPWSIQSIFYNIVVPELEIRSIFEQKRVRLITIQLNDSYDEHLRYFPAKIENIIATIFGLGQVTFIGIIDGFAFTKQAFVHSGVEATRVLNPPTVQATNVRNLNQLESIAVAYKDLYSLQHEEYTLQQDGDCSTNIEQYVLLKDEDMVKHSETVNGEEMANTRRLILMCDDYSYNAHGQKSGFIVERTLIRRLPVE